MKHKPIQIDDTMPDFLGMDCDATVKPFISAPIRTKADMDYWEIECLRLKAIELGLTGEKAKNSTFLF